MSVKKKAKNFGNDLRDVLIKHGKLDPDVIGYMLASEVVSFYTYGDPLKGLNAMFQTIVVAAGDQGYKIVLGGPPPESERKTYH